MTAIEKDIRDRSILSKFTEETYIKAIHDSWNSWCLKNSTSPLVELNKTPYLTTIISNVKVSLFNWVMFTRLSSENADEKIQEVIDFFSSKGLPFTWPVDPDDTPIDLPERLEKHGLSLSAGRGMAVKLSELRIPETQDDLVFKRVNNQGLLQTFSRVLSTGYGFPESTWDDLSRILIGVGLRDDYCHYLGYLDGKPVSTSSIVYSDGVAGIYCVSTLAEARGRRMGSMITAAPLIDARNRGYKVGVLHPSDLGYNVYKRLGFEEFCRMVRYVWYPEP